MDHFPKSHAHRVERSRAGAPQREVFKREEPLLDHAWGGWYLKYSSEPHRVVELVAGRSQASWEEGCGCPGNNVFSLFCKGSLKRKGLGCTQWREWGVCAFGMRVERDCKTPKCLGVSSRPRPAKTLADNSESWAQLWPHEARGLEGRAVCVPNQLLASEQGKDVMIGRKRMGSSQAPLRTSNYP